MVIPKPFHNNFVGFEEFFRDAVLPRTDTYPPHSILKLSDTHFRIELAVAGFCDDELDVEFDNSVVTVRGTRKDHLARDFLYKGISEKSFEKSFKLHDRVVLTGASLDIGILCLDLKLENQYKKPTKIPITSTKQQLLNE